MKKGFLVLVLTVLAMGNAFAQWAQLNVNASTAEKTEVEVFLDRKNIWKHGSWQRNASNQNIASLEDGYHTLEIISYYWDGSRRERDRRSTSFTSTSPNTYTLVYQTDRRGYITNFQLIRPAAPPQSTTQSQNTQGNPPVVINNYPNGQSQQPNAQPAPQVEPFWVQIENQTGKTVKEVNIYRNGVFDWEHRIRLGDGLETGYYISNVYLPPGRNYSIVMIDVDGKRYSKQFSVNDDIRVEFTQFDAD